MIEKHLGNTWLWDRVRVSGGAYGGFCSFDPHSGSFNFLSYRCGKCGRVEAASFVGDATSQLPYEFYLLSFGLSLHLTSPVPLPCVCYRDPNLMETVDVYDGSAAFLRELELGGDELTKVGASEFVCVWWGEGRMSWELGLCPDSCPPSLPSSPPPFPSSLALPVVPSLPSCRHLPPLPLPLQAIIGTMGDIDSYQLPDAKGSSALSRYLLNVTDEERQQRREEILGTSAKDFK